MILREIIGEAQNFIYRKIFDKSSILKATVREIVNERKCVIHEQLNSFKSHFITWKTVD